MLSLFLLSLLFSWCAVLTHTWSSCHAGVVRFLLDGCYGRWFVYAQNNAPGTVFCGLRQTAHSVTLTTACRRHVHSAENKFRWHEYRSALSVDCWSIRSGKYPDAVTWACVVRMKARFVLLICKLSPGVITLYHFWPKLSVMGPMGFTHIGDWVGRGMSDDFSEEFRRCNPELSRVTRAVLCTKYFRYVWMRFETQLRPV